MADKVADMVAEMVADMEVDKMADMEVDLGMVADIDINMEIQFGERVGHGGWSIGPKTFSAWILHGLRIFLALRVYCVFTSFSETSDKTSMSGHSACLARSSTWQKKEKIQMRSKLRKQLSSCLLDLVVVHIFFSLL